MTLTKRVFFVLLSLIDLYFLYAIIGYLILALKTPKIYGETITYFTGMYIMSISFLILFISLTTILALMFRKYKRRKNRILSKTTFM